MDPYPGAEGAEGGSWRPPNLETLKKTKTHSGFLGDETTRCIAATLTRVAWVMRSHYLGYIPGAWVPSSNHYPKKEGIPNSPKGKLPQTTNQSLSGPSHLQNAFRGRHGSTQKLVESRDAEFQALTPRGPNLGRLGCHQVRVCGYPLGVLLFRQKINVTPPNNKPSGSWLLRNQPCVCLFFKGDALACLLCRFIWIHRKGEPDTGDL